MALGRKVQIEEFRGDDGSTAQVLVPLEGNDPRGDEHDMREHFTLLKGSGDEFDIVEGRATTIEVHQSFVKFSVSIRQNVVAYIAIDHEASDVPGAYDDVHPGNGRLVDRCPPAKRLSLFFEGPLPDPMLPVEVILYAGPSSEAAS